jgi:hypothetical protein
MPCPRRPPGFYMPSVHHRGGDAARRRGEGDRVCSAICPICGGPMTPRLARNGPYFHCLCYERGEKP